MKDRIEMEVLQSGIKFLGCKTDRFKNTRISIRFALPLNESTVSDIAVLPGLLKYTSKAYPENIEMEKKLASLYGASFFSSLDKLGDFQVVSYVINCVADKFALAEEEIASECAEFIKDAVFHPDFNENGEFKDENIEREKRFLKEAIESDKADKMVYSCMRFDEIMFSGEGAALPAKGYIDGADKVNAKSALEAWNLMLSNAQVQIAVIGNCDIENIKNMFIKQFETIERKYNCETQKAHTASNEIKTVSEKMQMNQAKLAMGWSVGSSDESALRVLNAVFGSGVNSKLFKVVREKMSLCYYCSSRTSRAKKALFVYSGIENDNAQKVIKAVNEQLEKVKNAEFSDEEFTLAKIALDDAFKSISDTAREIDMWHFSQMLDEKSVSVEEYRKSVAEVTRERIIKCAQTIKEDTIYMLSSDGENL